LAPREKGRERLFTCGPSVYRQQYPGNYRFYLFEDDFEARMNDNLDYAGAFDAVAEQLTRAARLDRSDGIPRAGRERLRSALREVDRVLGVFELHGGDRP
jgi:cysteinyl-tRNA synthetase